MRRFQHQAACIGVKSHTEDLHTPSKNHLASDQSLSTSARKKIASMGLTRVAGNVYECPSTQDFWKVQGNSIIRLSADEVSNGESIPAAPRNDSAGFLADILDDLTF